MVSLPSQQGDHHIGCASEEGLNPSLYDLSLEEPQVDALLYHNQLIDASLWGSPTGTFNPSLCTPRGGDDCAPLAGKQPHHPHSGPRCGGTVYLTFPDNTDYSGNRTDPYDQGDPPSEVGLIGYHKEHIIFIIAGDPHTCTCRMTNPSRLVCFPPNPTRFNG